MKTVILLLKIGLLVIFPFIIGLIFLFISSDSVEESDIKTIKWMTETSKVKIPLNAKRIGLYNNHEWGVIVKFNLSRSDWNSFTVEYDMKPIKSLSFRMQLLTDIENINYKKTNEKNFNEYLYFSDCKGGNSWSVLGDKRTRIIWFEVLYPDNGGDFAPCDSNLINSL
jgi:hypothetical protein